MAVSGKEGFLVGFDLADNKQLYKTAVTTIENADTPFSTETETHFCPGAGGGEEWNSPAYNPQTNLIYTGDVDGAPRSRPRNSRGCPREDVDGRADAQPGGRVRRICPL